MTRHTVALLAVCLLTFFAGLGAPALTDSDEAFYAESAREMVESGDWLTPHFNYEYRFEKPVLYYWLVALAYEVSGVTEAAARFPSAMAGIGLVLIAFVSGRRWLDPETGRLAGLVTATCFGCMIAARQALPDLPLAFFISLSVWSGLEAWLAPSTPTLLTRTLTQWAWIALSAAAAGAAFLTKGPIGLVLPALAVGPPVAWGAIRRRRWPVPQAEVGLALAIVMLVAAPWYVAMTQEHGVPYLDRFFLSENLDRFATSRYNDPRPLWYYLPIVAGGLLPWTPFLALWIPRAWNGLRHLVGPSLSTVAFVWWAVAPVLFFTLSIGKQPRYVLPALVPLAVLTAEAIRYRQRTTRRRDPLFAACAALGGVTLVTMGALVGRAAPLFFEWETSVVTMSALAIAGAGVGVLVVAGRPRLVPYALVGASIVVVVTSHYVLLASPGPAPVERMAEMLNDAAAPDQRSSRFRVFNRKLIYYSQRPFEELNVIEAARDFLRSADPVLLIVPEDDVPRLQALDAPVRPLGFVDYVNTGSFTLRMLIDPDPTRYRQRVMLVTNRGEGELR